MSSSSTAVVFPGQGSQYPKMLSEYFSEVKGFDEPFLKASEVINKDLIRLINEGLVEDLSKTEITQPLLLAANFAIWKIIEKKNIKIDFLAGHSLGEYSALIASQSLSFEDCLKIVKKRAELMQNAVPEGEGGIAAIIGLNQSEIANICEEITQSDTYLVHPANINSSNQIVISGNKNAIEEAIELCKERGAKRAIPLAMSVPSHCKLMKPASVEFKYFIDGFEFKKPEIPVVNNVNASIEQDEEKIKDNLIKQLYNSVRWNEIMLFLKDKEVERFIECGPSKVLNGLIKREIKAESINTDSIENLKLI